MSNVKIHKGGSLSKTRWETDARANVTTDVTEFAYRYLYDTCTLADGVTLRDIFLLIREHIEIFDAVLGNWCKELVTEGLDKPCPADSVSQLDYLQLYWRFNENTSEKIFEGYHFPGFDGWGDYEDGRKGLMAVEFSPANTLIDVVVQLKTTIEISDEDDYKTPPRELQGTFTLGHILYGILWELSFCGSPVDRDEMRDHIGGLAEDVMQMTPDQLRLLPTVGEILP